MYALADPASIPSPGEVGSRDGAFSTFGATRSAVAAPPPAPVATNEEQPAPLELAPAPAASKAEGKRRRTLSNSELNELTEGPAMGEDTQHQMDRPGRSSVRLPQHDYNEPEEEQDAALDDLEA